MGEAHPRMHEAVVPLDPIVCSHVPPRPNPLLQRVLQQNGGKSVLSSGGHIAAGNEMLQLVENWLGVGWELVGANFHCLFLHPPTLLLSHWLFRQREQEV